MTPLTLFADASKSFERGRYTDALTALNRLLDHAKDAKTYALLARTLIALSFKTEAAHTYVLAAELGGPDADTYYAEAMKLHFELGHDDAALSLGLPLLQKAQHDADLAFIIASLFRKRGEKQAIRAFLPVLSASSNPKHTGLAFMLLTGAADDTADREALAAMQARMPKSLPLLMAHLVTQREVNNYKEIERLQPQLDRILAKTPQTLLQVEAPFYNLTWLANEAMNKKVGYFPDAYSLDKQRQRRSAPHQWARKIRIGYLSSDFWAMHATMKLLNAVLRAHDTERFDITLFCYTDGKFLDEQEAERRQWGRIVSVGDMTDAEAAQVIEQHGIDILIDLKGHTRGGRAMILNKTMVPVQVAWLGFPGTTVNVDLDYVIGDHKVLPDRAKPHYWEKFCRMPECYQPNNPNQPAAQTGMFTRAEAGLPQDAFVFASFNATRKISLRTINLWIRVLKATPGSVIWIMVKSREAQNNIERKLTDAGIAAERIVFTRVVPFEQHLSRITLADVGLDTFPYNGHTTTSEQLWAGLPVLTLKGTHFASRVSESLLCAMGLPEMVARDEADYVRLAAELFSDRDKVAAFSKRLEENRMVKPLFDAERFCRHLETAFEMMAERARKGLPPEHIDVPALPDRTAPFL
ncbi:glycosyl transferase [Neorhizobium sp. NPDC001467]|uniref:O-linked N-acetylglucosamine transferase, SPINDLY family protein n=1 Tax=Neorhizobium sp. NPDC001467 TaxID=3390595 RepID=UPI003D0011EF